MSDEFERGIRQNQLDTLRALKSLRTGKVFTADWNTLLQTLGLGDPGELQTGLVNLKILQELETRDERRAFIESLQTPAGGYTRKTLQTLGVSWPPKNGWRYRLIRFGKFEPETDLLE